MGSTCISNCINDARIPLQRAYVNLDKWPESDVELVRSLTSNIRGGMQYGQPRVVDTISCRQMYLRSYTFSRKESVHEKTKKCIGKIKERVKNNCKRSRKTASSSYFNSEKKILRRAKSASCSVFQRLLSCTTKVDVDDHGD